jgi:hypothetical protein
MLARPSLAPDLAPNLARLRRFPPDRSSRNAGPATVPGRFSRGRTRAERGGGPDHFFPKRFGWFWQDNTLHIQETPIGRTTLAGCTAEITVFYLFIDMAMLQARISQLALLSDKIPIGFYCSLPLWLLIVPLPSP